MLWYSSSARSSSGSVSLQLRQWDRQDQRVGRRSDRQAGLVVVHGECAVGVLQPQLAALQHDAVVIAEHREQDLAAQLLLQRPPVDVEVLGVGGGAAVLEHVLPPGVGAAGDAHVVRHHVDEHAHAALAQLRGERVCKSSSAPISGLRSP